jgi:hypothetical protein
MPVAFLQNTMLRRPLLGAFAVLGVLWPAVGAPQTVENCRRNPDPTRWFVQAGASGTATGAKDHPFGSLADIERCAPAGATIVVLPQGAAAPALDGGIRLKDRQKLLGAEAAGSARGTPSARLTNTGGSGDAVTLAHGNEVANLHIENPAGAAIFGDNVNGALLRDLLVTRRTAATPLRLDPALCRVVRSGDGVDNARSTLRGCTSRQTPGSIKHGVMFLADDGIGGGRAKYTVQRVSVRDNPSHEKPEVLWPGGISITAAGRVAVTLDVQDTSIEYAARGIVARGYDRAAVTVNVTNTRIDSLRSDGITLSTGFLCSGLEKTTKTLTLDCGPLAPAPVSDARMVLNVDRLRFTDTARKGQPNDAAAIEPVAFDQGRSTIEVHVQRSDITGAAAVGMFTFYLYGRPAKDVMDLGCVNPAPGATAPNRRACRDLGYTSPGLNRVFGNTRNSESFSPYVEIALEGPGSLIAQGNYWGDILPADGKGDAFGACSVFNWSGDPKDTSPPVTPVPNSRCELYNIPAQGNPTGIDGRFHLVADPRPRR